MEGKSGIADLFLGFCCAILLDAINELKGSYRGSRWILIAKSPLALTKMAFFSVIFCKIGWDL